MAVIPPVYLALGTVILLLTVGRVVWRRGPKETDWALVVAFIRLDFPSDQRDIAQKIAAGLAEMVGLKIKQLRPEHTLEQIVGWAENRIHPTDVAKLFLIAFGVSADGRTTFRDLVERVAEKQANSPSPPI